MEPTAPPSPTIIATQSGDMFNQARGRFFLGVLRRSPPREPSRDDENGRRRRLPSLSRAQPEILLLTDDASASPRSQGKPGARAAAKGLEALPSDEHLQPSALRQPRRR